MRKYASKKGEIQEKFRRVHADDYYGKEGFKAVHEYLVNGGKSCMAGFVLKNTLSDNGGVTRGICKMDEQKNLTEVVETKNIVKTATGAEADGVAVDVNSLVSMNMWGLTPDFLDVLEEGFKEFFEKEVPGNPLKAEYLIPIFIGELLEQGKMSVKVCKRFKTDYYHGKIRKVYSIGVCTHPTKEFQNTLIRYSIRPEQLIGNAVEKSENYDLMSVVTICLGEPGTENYTGIVKFMDVLLSSSRAATEKKKILEEEFGVAMNEELEREVLVMCNLSQGVKAEGREEGINIGEMRMLVKQVRKGRVTIEEAAEDAGMTVEEFKKVMENTPLQAV